MSRPTFTVTFTADDTDGIRGARALLKTARRRFRLRAIDVREHKHPSGVCHRRAVWVSVRRQEQVTCH